MEHMGDDDRDRLDEDDALLDDHDMMEGTLLELRHCLVARSKVASWLDQLLLQ